MRRLLIAIFVMLSATMTARGAISVGINIGVNVPVFPHLVAVPNYPVYYDPDIDSNYFFYDGQYWVYDDDGWYSSSWYNGPWIAVDPFDVPAFILRVPVRYYHRPPPFFAGWAHDAPPRWGDHWGRDWQQRRPGWDKWNRQAVPRPAPLPVYQRQFSGDRYPHEIAQQRELHSQNYRYQPRDAAVRRVQVNVNSKAPPPQRNEPQHFAPRPQGGSQSRPGEAPHMQPNAPRPQREQQREQPSPEPRPNGARNDRHDDRPSDRGPPRGPSESRGDHDRGGDRGPGPGGGPGSGRGDHDRGREDRGDDRR